MVSQCKKKKKKNKKLQEKLTGNFKLTEIFLIENLYQKTRKSNKQNCKSKAPIISKIFKRTTPKYTKIPETLLSTYRYC